MENRGKKGLLLVKQEGEGWGGRSGGD